VGAGRTARDQHQSLGFYRAAWEWDPETDMGYGGVNAAYILDIIASRTRTIAVRCGFSPENSREAKEFADRATVLRDQILDKVTALAKKDAEQLLGFSCYHK
jgi:hypothetical protein